MKPITYHVYTAMYPLTFGFYYGAWNSNTLNQFGTKIGLQTKAQEREWIGPDKDTGGMCARFERGAIIWLPTQPRGPHAIGCLAHEITHAVGHSGRILGFKLNKNSEEFYCYLSGWLMNCGLDHKAIVKRKVSDK